MADSRVGITLEARNRATGAINEVKKSLGGLEGAATTATKGLAGLAGAFGVGALLQLGSTMGQAVVQMATMAQQASITRGAFEELAMGAGQSASTMLSALKQASGGAISEANLMVNANKAMMLGVADTADEMTALMAVAAKRGSALGLTMTQAFDNLVTGIGRGSALILDNLGISMGDIDKANQGLAESLGKTVEQLTDAEKKAALLRVVMDEAAGIDMDNVASMATDMERAKAAADDLKVALGEAFGPIVSGGAFLLSEALRAIPDSIDEANRASAQTSLEMVQPEIDRVAGQLATMREMLDLSAPLLTPSQTEAAVAEIKTVEDALKTLLEIWNRDAWAVGAPTYNIAESLKQARVVTQAEMTALIAEQQAGVAQVADAYAEVGNVINQQVNSAVQQMLGQLSAIEAYRFGENLRSTLTQIAADAQAAGTPFGLLRLMLMEAADANVLFMTTMGETPGVVEAAAEAVDRAERSLRLLGGTLEGVQGALGNTAAQVWNLAGSFLDLAADAVSASVTMSKTFTLAQTGLAVSKGAAQARIDELTDSLSKPKMPSILPRALRDIEDIRVGAKYATPAIASFGAAGRSAGSSMAAGLSEADRAAQNLYNTIEGKVKGVLSEALNLDVGVNPEDYLPRPDAINENARRLADIMVNGFKGQDWLEEFKSEVPDIYKVLAESGDPRATAAQLLQDFQAGLVPDLIDKEAAKDRVRRMLLGEQNAAALAQEIASELATEMGVSLGQATQAAQTALGVATPGGKAAEGVALNGQAEGDKFIEGVQIAITARVAEMQASGATVGNAWGSAFLGSVSSSVPSALVSILVGAVLSGMSTYNSQTAAVN